METNDEVMNPPHHEHAISNGDLRHDLRAELAASASDLRALKHWARRPPAQRTEPPATRSGLTSVREASRRATLLHLGLAHLRRRQHARSWCGEPIDDLAAQAARLAIELARLGKLTVSTPALDEAWRRRLEVMLRGA